MCLTLARHINVGILGKNLEIVADSSIQCRTQWYTNDTLLGPRLSPILIPSNRSRIFVFQSTFQIDPSHDQRTEILKLWHKPPWIKEVADELDTWLNIASLCICFFLCSPRKCAWLVFAWYDYFVSYLMQWCLPSQSQHAISWWVFRVLSCSFSVNCSLTKQNISYRMNIETELFLVC